MLVSPSKAMDIADTGLGDSPGVGGDKNTQTSEDQIREQQHPANIMLPSRPQIRREQPQPPPPQQPPPPPAPVQGQSSEPSTDSLSLMQLKRLVTDMPRTEPTLYAFNYADTASFPEEIEEWFSYSDEEQTGLLDSKMLFDIAWEGFREGLSSPERETSWQKASKKMKDRFVSSQVNKLEEVSSVVNSQRVAVLLYIALGAWGEIGDGDPVDRKRQEHESSSLKIPPRDVKYLQHRIHIERIIAGTKLLQEQGAFPIIFAILKSICNPSSSE